MTAKARPDKPANRTWTGVRLVLPFALVVLFLAGLIWAGRWGLDHLRGHDRYKVCFADIECEPPVSIDRNTFLDEVRYPNRLPEHVHLLDDDLQPMLRQEFGQHPWVEKVNEIEISPPKRIVVTLTYRVPVLAVKADGKLRAVDGTGVLLPMNAPTLGLPVYEGDAEAPVGAGKHWGDPKVEAAARRMKK